MKLWQPQLGVWRPCLRIFARRWVPRWLGGKGHAAIWVIFASGVAMGIFDGLQAAPLAGIKCDVTARSSDGWMKFSGVVRTPQPIEGDYRLVVVSTASGGTSHVSQSGAFYAKADIPLILGAVVVKSNGKRTHAVHLRLRTSDGQTCEETRQPDARMTE